MKHRPVITVCLEDPPSVLITAIRPDEELDIGVHAYLGLGMANARGTVTMGELSAFLVAKGRRPTSPYRLQEGRTEPTPDPGTGTPADAPHAAEAATEEP